MKANSKRKVFGDAVDLLMGDMEEVTMPRGVQMLPVKSIQPFHDHPFHLYEGERLDDILCMTGMARQCMGLRLLVEVVWLQSFLMRTVHSW